MNKYTVLGSSGFIGSHLVNYFSSLGIKCFTPTRDQKLEPAQNLGNVIYCIGLTSDFRSKPFETVQAHVSKLAEVLEQTTFDSFLYLSSARVYTGTDTAIEDADISVNSADPSDLYNISKLMGEALCFSQNNDQVKVVRMSNVIGSDYSSENFLFQVIREAVANNLIDLKTSLRSEKDYIHISDASKIIYEIIERGKERIYNVASGRNVSNAEIVEVISQVTGCEVNSKENSENWSLPKINIDRISNEFSFSYRDILNEIKGLTEDYRENNGK